MAAPRKFRSKNLLKILLLVFVILAGGFSFVSRAGASPAGQENPAGPVVCGKSVTAGRAVVVSADSIASRVGAEILIKGGNAIDATVAVGFALAVTYPRAGNIGGGGFLLVRLSSGETHFIDYREKAPLRAHRDMYLDSNGNVIPNASLEGYRSVGVPGTVAGFWLAHKTFGTLPWRELIEPACRLAREGFEVPDSLVSSIKKSKDLLASHETSRKIFLEPQLKPGDCLIQPELASTLERIRDEGPDDFYSGETARLLVSDMEANGGLITMEDLAAYEAVFREPIEFMYRGYLLIGAPLPSSGGIIIAQVLQMIEPLDLSGLFFHSAGHVHVMSEAEKIAYRIRALFLGDTDFYPSPRKALTSGSYIQRLQKLLDPQKALTVSEIEALDLTPPKWRKPETRRARQGSRPSGGGIRSSGDHDQTTHFSIVDRWGNAVSNTYTLNESYGSGVTVPGAGFLLNCEMDDFSIKPGHPNLYGLVGSDANAIEPGKRMLSSMSPMIVLKDGRLLMVVGSPGGSRIPTSVLQVISNVIDFGKPLEEAVAVPRVHAQYLPDEIRIEKNALETSVCEALEKMGHRIVTKKLMGDIQAILFADGRLVGVSDPRGNGCAAGY